jgi:hypothetical protein
MRGQDLAVARDLTRLGASVMLIGQDLPDGSGELVFRLPLHVTFSDFGTATRFTTPQVHQQSILPIHSRFHVDYFPSMSMTRSERSQDTTLAEFHFRNKNEIVVDKLMFAIKLSRE